MAQRNSLAQKVENLRTSLFLTYDSIALAKKGLLASPSKEEERELNRLIGALGVEAADIETRLNDALDGDTSVTGPTAEQVQSTAALTAEVEALTKGVLVASAVVSLATKVLDLASEIA